MKTLNKHVILYDAECPMCKLYTRAFTKSGMLDANGRAAYQHIPDAICPVVDRQRAVNEVALVNISTGEVTYGISSLLKVTGNALPVFKPLFAWQPFIWFMSKVYAFISYNRRVIIPAPQHSGYSLQPTFRLNYRLYYLAFTWLLTSAVLTAYAHLLAGTVPVGNSYREYLICGGQIIFQGLIITFYAPGKRWNYLGNMMTISLAGTLMLSLGFVVNNFVLLSSGTYAAYFMAVAGLMFLEHIRRARLLGLGWLLTATWVAYRIALLLLIYKLN